MCSKVYDTGTFVLGIEVETSNRLTSIFFFRRKSSRQFRSKQTWNRVCFITYYVSIFIKSLLIFYNHRFHLFGLAETRGTESKFLLRVQYYASIERSNRCVQLLGTLFFFHYLSSFSTHSFQTLYISNLQIEKQNEIKRSVLNAAPKTQDSSKLNVDINKLFSSPP